MEIKRFITGELQSNSYLVYENKEAVLFDIGSSEIEYIKKYVVENNLTLTKIILTHGHIDHIKGVKALVDEFSELEIYIGEEDKEFLNDSSLNLSQFVYYSKIEFDFGGRVKTLNDDDEVFGFQVMSTPGHTIGSKVYYNKETGWLITGDTLFNGSMGRTDFPTGSFSSMQKSLKKILETYPSETIVYPGHGETTTIGSEIKKFNL